MTFVTHLVTFGGSGGSTLVTFVTDFVTFGGSGVNLVTFGCQGVKFTDICEGFCDLWGVKGVNFEFW